MRYYAGLDVCDGNDGLRELGMDPDFREGPTVTGVGRSAPAPRGAGFTLLELIITVMVVALLATLVYPMAEVAARRGQEQKLRVALSEIRHAIDDYRQAVIDGKLGPQTAGKSGYPPSLNVLVEGVPDATSTNKDAKIQFMRRMPRDPLATDSSVPAEDTWGKRSYASSPDDPQEGDDVFDVYSRSTGVGLNGIPYRQW